MRVLRRGVTLATTAALLSFGCRAFESHPGRIPTYSTPSIYPGVPTPGAGPTVEIVSVESPAGSAEVIDLDVALRLAGVDNPTINLAREAVREALAGQLAARSLLVPSVNVGGNFRYHNGPLLSTPGIILDVESRGLYLGLGSWAVGAGAVMNPGVRLFAHLGDAAYAPLAARQRVAARRSEAGAVQNAILLDVAATYLELVGAEARLDIYRKGERDIAEVVRLTAAFAKAGQGRDADANRAEANAELLRRDLRRAEEDVGVAVARLARLLSLDPSVSLRTAGGGVAPIRLVAEESDPESLIADALRTRPEVAARSAAVVEAQTRKKQERVRPFLPTVSVGYSAAGFGGGSNLVADPFTPLRSRGDFNATAVWTVQNFGWGNVARVRGANASLGAAIAEFDRTTNQVRQEVASAVADARAAASQMATARAALADAEEGYKLEAERIRQAQGLPIEVLDSFRQLLDSRLELLRATIAFNVAQFRLYVALGRTPSQ